MYLNQRQLLQAIKGLSDNKSIKMTLVPSGRMDLIVSDATDKKGALKFFAKHYSKLIETEDFQTNNEFGCTIYDHADDITNIRVFLQFKRSRYESIDNSVPVKRKKQFRKGDADYVDKEIYKFCFTLEDFHFHLRDSRNKTLTVVECNELFPIPDMEDEDSIDHYEYSADGIETVYKEEDEGGRSAIFNAYYDTYGLGKFTQVVFVYGCGENFIYKTNKINPLHIHQYADELNVTADNLFDMQVVSHGICTGFTNASHGGIEQIKKNALYVKENPNIQICCSDKTQRLGSIGLFVKGRTLAVSKCDLWSDRDENGRRYWKKNSERAEYCKTKLDYSLYSFTHTEHIKTDIEIVGIWVNPKYSTITENYVAAAEELAEELNVKVFKLTDKHNNVNDDDIPDDDDVPDIIKLVDGIGAMIEKELFKGDMDTDVPHDDEEPEWIEMPDDDPDIAFLF